MARTRRTLDLVDAQARRIVVSRMLTGTCPAGTKAVNARPPAIDPAGLFDACLKPHLDALFSAIGDKEYRRLIENAERLNGERARLAPLPTATW